MEVTSDGVMTWSRMEDRLNSSFKFMFLRTIFKFKVFL